MSTVKEQWSTTDIPAAIKLTHGFNERFKEIQETARLSPPLQTTAPTMTAATKQVLMSAQSHQNNASGFCLGQSVTLSSPSNNISKVKNVIQERQRMRALAQGNDHHIAVVASLWKVQGKKEQQVRAWSNDHLNLTFFHTHLDPYHSCEV